MGRKLLGASKLVLVSGSVPPAVKAIIDKMVITQGRSASQIVRQIIEESPRVKADLRKKAKK